MAAAASWGDHETEVFAVFADGTLRDRYWDGNAWHDWESLGGALTGQPAAAARDADRIDVMAIGRDGRLHHRWWDGTRWVEWRALDAPRGATAVSCSWIGGELRVFVVADGGLYTTTLRP